jgi:flagellar biogenesis protein FliO
VALNAALPSWNMLVSVLLLAMLGTNQRLVFVPVTNTALLLGSPMLPKWRGKDLDIFAIGTVSLNHIL